VELDLVRRCSDPVTFPDNSIANTARWNESMSQDHDENEEIVLSALPDTELVEQMFDDLYDGLADEIAEATQILLSLAVSRSEAMR